MSVIFMTVQRARIVPGGRWLLLGQAVKGSESPDEIDRVYPDNLPSGKFAGDHVERFTIVRVVERRDDDDFVRDIEVRVARRQPLSFHDDRARIRDLHDTHAGGFDPRMIFDRTAMIRIVAIRLVGEQHRPGWREPRDVVDVPVSIIADTAFAEPYGIRDSEVVLERGFIIGAGQSWITHLHVAKKPLFGDKQ